MEFLKSCGTGTQALAGWTTIRYLIYAVVLQDATDPEDETTHEDSDIVLQQELFALTKYLISLRQQKYAAFIDLRTPSIWVFLPSTEQSHFAHVAPHHEPKPRLQLVFEGSFVSSLLASQQSMSQSVDLMISSRKENGILPAKLTTKMSNANIYSNFVSAIKQSLIYRLVSNSSFVPLGSSLVLLNSSLGDAINQQRAPSYVYAVGLSTYLTSSGTLVCSLYPVKNPKFLPLATDSGSSQQVSSSRLLVLAPLLVPAIWIAPAHHAQSPRLDGFWTDYVRAWCAQAGLTPANLNSEVSWVYVEVMFEQSATATEQERQKRKLLWPANLCFSCAMSHDSTATIKLPASAPEADQTNSLEDIIQFSEQWSRGWNDNAKQNTGAMEAKRDYATMLGREHDSPSQIRPVTYGDLHGGNGVYPTPPDGLVSVPPSQPNVIAPSPLQSIDMSVVSNQGDTSNSRAEDDVDIQIEEDDAHDDLFGQYEDNDITDADFNFFDADEDDFLKTVKDDANDAIKVADAVPAAASSERDVEQDIQMLDSDVVNAASEMLSPIKQTLAAQKVVLQSLDPAEVLRRLFHGNTELIRVVDEDTDAFSSLKFNNALNDVRARYDTAGGIFEFGSALSISERKNSLLTDSNHAAAGNRARQSSARTLSQSHAIDPADENDDGTNSIVCEDDSLARAILDHQGIASVDHTTVEQNADNGAEKIRLGTADALVLKQIIAQSASDDFLAKIVAIMKEQRNSQSIRPSMAVKPPLAFTGNLVASSQLIADHFHYDTLAWSGTQYFNGEVTVTSDSDPSSIRAAQSTASRIFPKSSVSNDGTLSLLKYAAMSDAPPELSQNKPQNKLPQSKGPNAPTAAGFGGTPVSLPAQLIRIRRNDALFDMRPSAVAFWDVLGLAPTSGPKNVSAYALFPNIDHLKSLALKFMDDIGQCYDNSKLGKHVHDTLADLGTEFDTFRTSDGQTSKTFTLHCMKAGHRLATLDYERARDDGSADKSGSHPASARIIYIINPFHESAVLHSIAHGFMLLREAWRRTKIPITFRRPLLVMKIIQLSHLNNLGGIVLLSSPMIQNLAREVYNKCPPMNVTEDCGALPLPFGSSIQLMETLPRKIAFELSANPPSDIMQDPSHLHLGYSVSDSGNWVSAAYSDNVGRYQATITYCLTGTRKFADIANEMWQTCVEIMSARKVNWRLYVLKSGNMTADEMQVWKSLSASQAPTPALTVFTLIMSLDSNPSLALVPPVALPLTPPSTANLRTTAQTPAATPSTPAVISPDPSAQTPAGTPSESFNAVENAANDPDAHLVDMTDETYAIILGHRITLPIMAESAQMAVWQALSTALLIRVPPAMPAANPYNAAEILSPDHAPCIAIHLVHARPRNIAKMTPSPAGASSAAFDTPPSTPGTSTNTYNESGTTPVDVPVPKAASDTIMREAVTHLRNLALLAKIRGIKDGMTGLIPWHALVTQRAVDGLDLVYGTQSWKSLPRQEG